MGMRAHDNKGSEFSKIFSAVTDLGLFLQRSANHVEEVVEASTHWYGNNRDAMKNARDERFAEYGRRYWASPIHGLIAGQISTLDEYIKQLNAYNDRRFGNVSGPLYDMDSGWNPQLRIHQADLLSALPREPFSDIHPKRDIPIGIAPTEPEEDSIGYMPFKWFHDQSTVMYVNPIAMEIVRAKARQDWWRHLLDVLGIVYVNCDLGG